MFDGSREATEVRDRIQAMVARDAVLAGGPNYALLPRVARYTNALRVLRRMLELRREHALSPDEFLLLRSEAIADALPTDLHELAFVPVIRSQGSDEQQAAWLADAESYRMIGAYAQTELGHGSNVRALETTARWHAASDELEIHSPTVTSYKWWPGNMSKTANHVVCMARLLVGPTDHGVHAFLVQIRSMVDHSPMRGVTIGDIGTKLGMNAVDNGYLRFDRVRVPRFAMFARYATLSREGVYSQPPHAKLAYGGMVHVRASIIANAGAVLARAATIATRYSAVRLQFSTETGADAPESPVLDYGMQQYRVLPLVATAFALRFAGAWMSELYTELVAQMARGDLTLLPEVHAASSGLKSFTTTLAGDGIETLRKACGGHGFLASSGLPDLFAGYVGVLTAEGENYLLTQQTARALLKTAQRALAGKECRGASAYLADGAAELARRAELGTRAHWRSERVQMAALEHRATRLVASLGAGLQAELAAGKSAGAAWSALQVVAYRVSAAHSLVLVARAFASALARAPASVALVLGRLRDLFVLFHLELAAADLLADGYLTGDHTHWLGETVRELLDELRGDAVAIVDAFGMTDLNLNSALGRYDGDVYAALLRAAHDDPMNAPVAPGAEPTPGYRAYLEPIIKGRL